MRLNNYLIQEEFFDAGFDNFVDAIKSNCKPYLKKIGNNYRGPLLRSMMRSKNYGYKTPRQNRESQGTSHKTFKSFNKWLEKNGHLRRDKSVSCTTDEQVIDVIPGIIHWVFPIGKFKYSWIKSTDVNIPDMETGWGGNVWLAQYFNPDFKGITVNSKRINMFGEPDNLNDWIFTNKKFKTPWKNEWEIWFSQPYYYMKQPAIMWKQFASEYDIY